METLSRVACVTSVSSLTENQRLSVISLHFHFLKSATENVQPLASGPAQCQPPPPTGPATPLSNQYHTPPVLNPAPPGAMPRPFSPRTLSMLGC